MKVFRKKFTKNNYFPALIITYALLIILIYPTLLTLDRPEEMILGGVLLISAIEALYTLRVLFACCYITITDTKIALINPYIRFYREFSFSDISRAEIKSGGVKTDLFLLIWDKNGKRFFKEIALVRWKDLNEVVEIFEEHGIKVKKFWKGYLE